MNMDTGAQGLHIRKHPRPSLSFKFANGA